MVTPAGTSLGTRITIFSKVRREDTRENRHPVCNPNQHIGWKIPLPRIGSPSSVPLVVKKFSGCFSHLLEIRVLLYKSEQLKDVEGPDLIFICTLATRFVDKISVMTSDTNEPICLSDDISNLNDRTRRTGPVRPPEKSALKTSAVVFVMIPRLSWFGIDVSPRRECQGKQDQASWFIEFTVCLD